MNAEQMLAKHREVWDMPTLASEAPEIIEWLSERYGVVFPEDFTGQVYVVHTQDGHRMEKMGTTDVRVAVATLLDRAAKAEMSEGDPEGYDPTRLSAGDGSAQNYFTETSL